MIKQLKTEIKITRKILTLIMLILPYSLFIASGLVFNDAFTAIFIGTSLSFVFFIIANLVLSNKIDTKYKNFIPEDTKIHIEKSYSIKLIALYIFLHASTVAILFAIAKFDDLAFFMAIISLILIGAPILSINWEIDSALFKPMAQNMKNDNNDYTWSAYSQINNPGSDTWHNHPSMPGNPIYTNFNSYS